MADFDGLTLSLSPDLNSSLVEVCASRRCSQLAMLDAYGRSTQYEDRRYDWDGKMTGYGEQADISPGWYVPLKLRKPKARLDLPKLINKRLSAFTLGSERWPEIRVDGDSEAEDYLKAMAEAAKLPAKMLEAREKGGACGTAVVSFKFTAGAPRVLIHEARNVHVLRWVDKDERIIGAVLKAYGYQRQVWDRATGKPKQVTLYYARYWDETCEIVWDPIPEPYAKRGDWSTSVTSYRVDHEFGECPVYWVQNLPESEHEDGLSDFEGLCDQFDEINETLSSTAKGTKANVDPTLVIKDDPGNNPGMVRKGSGNAIYSKGGADYLELGGGAVEAGLLVVDRLAQMCLDLAGVVVADPKDLASKAQSAAALKIMYQPMIATCDVLRSQYGELIQRLLLGMLRAARKINATPAGPIQTTADGYRIQEKPQIILPPRFETVEGVTAKHERVPGTSEHVTLKWPPYFAATSADIEIDVKAATAAKGQLIAAKTAVKFTARHFGVTDVEQELAELEAEHEIELERQLLLNAPPDPAATDEDDGGEE